MTWCCCWNSVFWIIFFGKLIFRRKSLKIGENWSKQIPPKHILLNRKWFFLESFFVILVFLEFLSCFGVFEIPSSVDEVDEILERVASRYKAALNLGAIFKFLHIFGSAAVLFVVPFLIFLSIRLSPSPGVLSSSFTPVCCPLTPNSSNPLSARDKNCRRVWAQLRQGVIRESWLLNAREVFRVPKLFAVNEFVVKVVVFFLVRPDLGAVHSFLIHSRGWIG